MLEQLESSNSKNMTEQALAAWLWSLYYFSIQDWPHYGEKVATATWLRDFLPTKMAIKSTQNLFEYQKFVHRYGDAMDTLLSMRYIDKAKLEDKTLEIMKKPLLAAMNKPGSESIQVDLGFSGSAMVNLYKETLQVDLNKGRITMLEVRCSNGVYPLNIAVTKPFAIPQEAIDCALIATGDQNTTITLTLSKAKR